jgi:hypothetical protein
MSSERMQNFLKGVAKGGQLTFEKFYSPLPYEENTPMSNVCVAFVKEYNKICDAANAGHVTPKAAATNIVRLHEDTFGDARTEKYAKFNDQFFDRALADTPENKRLMGELKKTYVPSSNPFDNSLMADLIVGTAVRAATWPFRVVGDFRREASRRENIKIMGAIDASTSSIGRHATAIEGAFLDSKGNLTKPPTTEILDSFSRNIADIQNEAAALHRQMDEAESKKILSAMAAESVDRIDAANTSLQKSRHGLEQLAASSPEMAQACKKPLQDLDQLFASGDMIHAEVRAHAAQLEFQSKNMEEILRLRIETNESLSKSDIAILESAHEDLKRRRADIEKTLTGPHAKVLGEAEQSERMQKFRARMEAFEKRMGSVDELLSDPKATNKFISDELKTKLKQLVDPEALKKIGEALRSLFKSFGLSK